MRLRIGDFTFDAASRQLLRGTEEVHLTLKAFELLRLLVDRRPSAVSKEEIQTHLWPTTDREELLMDARSAFAGEVLIAREMLEIHVP